MINEKGYSHVTVKDIVQRAEYNRATFYLAHGTAGLILDWAGKGYCEPPREITGELITIFRAFSVGFRVECRMTADS